MISRKHLLKRLSIMKIPITELNRDKWGYPIYLFLFIKVDFNYILSHYILTQTIIHAKGKVNVIMNLKNFKDALFSLEGVADDAIVVIEPEGKGLSKYVKTFGFVTEYRKCYFECEPLDVSESVFIDAKTHKFVIPSPEMEEWKEKLDALHLVRNQLTAGTLKKALSIPCPLYKDKQFDVEIKYDRFTTIDVIDIQYSSKHNKLYLYIASYTNDVSNDFDKALDLLREHIDELATKENKYQANLIFDSISNSIDALNSILYDGRNFGKGWMIR